MCGSIRPQVSWGQGTVCTHLEGRSSAVVPIENPALAVVSTSHIGCTPKSPHCMLKILPGFAMPFCAVMSVNSQDWLILLPSSAQILHCYFARTVFACTQSVVGMQDSLRSTRSKSWANLKHRNPGIHLAYSIVLSGLSYLSFGILPSIPVGFVRLESLGTLHVPPRAVRKP